MRGPADSEGEAGGLPVVRRNAAGIDLGSEKHWVCAPRLGGPGREVEAFGATTPELERMAAWVQARNVESVAMESTGVYWIAPHEVLERHGLEVVQVDTRQLAHVPGRKKKTDPVDRQWIQRTRFFDCRSLLRHSLPWEWQPIDEVKVGKPQG